MIAIKNDNGFTLVEMIVVIGILAGFFSILLVNFSSEITRINKKQTKNIEKQVIEAAEAFVVINKDNPDSKYDNLRKVLNRCGCLNISIDTLIDEGLLPENTVPNSLKNKYKFVYFGYDGCYDANDSYSYDKGYQYRFDGCSCSSGNPGCENFKI